MQKKKRVISVGENGFVAKADEYWKQWCGSNQIFHAIIHQDANGTNVMFSNPRGDT